MSQPILPSATPAPRRHLPALIVLTIVVLGTFVRLIGSDFSWYDDQLTLHQNALFNPPGWHSIVHAWTRPELGLYIPVTYTLWTLIAMFAHVGSPDEFNVMLNPWLFHAASVALHVGSTWLVYFLLRRLLATRFEGEVTFPAVVGAALFAVHPLQTETLGWVSGMKDVLCWFGALAATLIYVRRAQSVDASGRPIWASWAMPAATLVFALALLSKPSSVVAPAAMLAIAGILLKRPWLGATVELLPLFAMSAVAAVFARQFQFVGMAEHVPLWQRPFVAGDAATFYLQKFFVPFPLTIDYGRRPTLIVERPLTYVIWVVPAALAIGAWLVRRREPLLTLAAAIAAIGIAPVSGLATFQMQQFSTTTDHYVYFAMVGPALIAAWALARRPTRATRAVAVVLIALLAARSFDQSRVWRDTFTLFRHASEVRPDSVIAQTNLAAVQLGRMVPDIESAREHVERALAIDPDNYYALQTYGVIMSRLNRADEAAKSFDTLWRKCVELDVGPGIRREVSMSAFGAMMTMGDYARAVEWAERAVRASPSDYIVVNALATARTALADQQRAAKASPTTAATAPAPASAPSR